MAKRPAPPTRVIADRLAPKMRRRFLAAVATMKSQVDVDALLIAAAARDAAAVERALRISAMSQQFATAAAVVAEVFNKVGAVSAGLITTGDGVTFRFDIVNPRAVAIAQAGRDRILEDLTVSARKSIRTLIATGLEDGVTVAETARSLRASIGRSPRQVAASAAYRQRLVEQGGRSAKRIDDMVGAFERKQLRFRAKLIARHETAEAANAGQSEAWRQAEAKGLIKPERTQRQWKTATDERVCPICNPMHNQVVAFRGEPFITGEGNSVDRPPEAHIACRCSIALVFPKP